MFKWLKKLFSKKTKTILDKEGWSSMTVPADMVFNNLIINRGSRVDFTDGKMNFKANTVSVRLTPLTSSIIAMPSPTRTELDITVGSDEPRENNTEGKEGEKVNVYYDSEKVGLSILCSLDEDGLSYEYNTFLVFFHTESGRLYWASDSGCSCPTPFEGHWFTDADQNSLQEITAASWDNFERDVDGFPVSRKERDDCIYKTKAMLRFKEAVFGKLSL